MYILGYKPMARTIRKTQLQLKYLPALQEYMSPWYVLPSCTAATMQKKYNQKKMIGYRYQIHIHWIKDHALHIITDAKLGP